jgi:ribosomal protein S18 acetylase RimI-like enzyme
MSDLRQYRADDVPGLVEAWNACFAGGPNFVRVTEADLRWRVLGQPAFDGRGVVVARSGGAIVGFVHFGPRLDLWDEWGRGPRDAEEGHIHALVAPESERALAADLMGAAEARLVADGARRILLGPSWVYGVQPFYNGIAGAYEIPGLGATRESTIAVARERGFEQVAEYGTPELDLSGPEPLRHLADAAIRLRALAREWGMGLSSRPIELRFFPRRISVELVRGPEIVAATAYGQWPEYIRDYRRRLYGITSVQVSPNWRGKGLGKLIMIEAMEAARKDGAEGVHLHVWRGNEPAWNLYHRALGFQPRYSWITLEKKIV